MRIYDDYNSVPAILQQCKTEFGQTNPQLNDQINSYNINLKLLNNCISRLPVEEIRERRRNFNILYREAMTSAEGRGMSFTAMLLMLAHYKIIDDNKALRY